MFESFLDVQTALQREKNESLLNEAVNPPMRHESMSVGIVRHLQVCIEVQSSGGVRDSELVFILIPSRQKEGAAAFNHPLDGVSPLRSQG